MQTKGKDQPSLTSCTYSRKAGLIFLHAREVQRKLKFPVSQKRRGVLSHPLGSWQDLLPVPDQLSVGISFSADKSKQTLVGSTGMTGEMQVVVPPWKALFHLV